MSNSRLYQGVGVGSAETHRVHRGAVASVATEDARLRVRGDEETRSRSRRVGEGVRSGRVRSAGWKAGGTRSAEVLFVIHSAGPFAGRTGSGARAGGPTRAIARGRARSSRDGARGRKVGARAARSSSGAPGGLHAAGGGRGGRDGGRRTRACWRPSAARDRRPARALEAARAGRTGLAGGSGHAGEHHGGHGEALPWRGARRKCRAAGPRAPGRAPWRTTQPFLHKPGSISARADFPPVAWTSARLRQGAKGVPSRSGGSRPGAQRSNALDRASDATGTQNHCMNRSIRELVRVRGHLSSTSTPALEFSIWRKILHAIHKYLPGIGEKCFENHFLETQRFRYAPSRRVPSPRGAAEPPRRARAPRERTASEAGAGRSRTPGPRGAGALGIRSRPRGARAIDDRSRPPQRPRAVPLFAAARRSNLAPPLRRASADRVPRRTADRTSRRPPPSRSPPAPRPLAHSPAAVATPATRESLGEPPTALGAPGDPAGPRGVAATTPATTPAPRDPPRAMSTPPPRARGPPGSRRDPRSSSTDEADEAASRVSESRVILERRVRSDPRPPRRRERPLRARRPRAHRRVGAERGRGVDRRGAEQR